MTIKKNLRVLLKMVFWIEKKFKEIIYNENTSEPEYASVEDPLNMQRTATNETTLISDIPNMINEENVIIVPCQGKTPVSILGDKFCEEQAFPYFLPKGKFGLVCLEIFQEVLLGTLI